MEIWGWEGSCVVMKVYSEEFKADAVALYLSDPTRTYASVAKDLGVNRETLRLWVRQARAGQAGGQSPDRRGGPGAAPIASDAVLEEEIGSSVRRCGSWRPSGTSCAGRPNISRERRTGEPLSVR
jgi:transposase